MKSSFSKLACWWFAMLLEISINDILLEVLPNFTLLNTSIQYLNTFATFSSISVAEYEQVNLCRVDSCFYTNVQR